MTYNKFKAYIKEEIEKINFEEIYDKASQGQVYDERYICDIIRKVIYYLEFNEGYIGKIEMLKFYLSAIEGVVYVCDNDKKCKKPISRLELLYIIQTLDE